MICSSYQNPLHRFWEESAILGPFANKGGCLHEGFCSWFLLFFFPPQTYGFFFGIPEPHRVCEACVSASPCEAASLLIPKNTGPGHHKPVEARGPHTEVAGLPRRREEGRDDG